MLAAKVRLKKSSLVQSMGKACKESLLREFLRAVEMAVCSKWVHWRSLAQLTAVNRSQRNGIR